MAERLPSVGRRTAREIEIDRRTDEVIGRLGATVAAGRRRRRLTQAELAGRVGISRSALSRIELGGGRGAPISAWLRLALGLGLRPQFDLARDWREDPVDAGHLAIQELLAGCARRTGYRPSFELPIRPNDPARSIDVLIRSDSARRLIVEEAWNSIGDIGAGARSFDRKIAAAREMAVAIGGPRPYAVGGVWVVRASRRNRLLVARYPGVFVARFPGSSRAWVRALTIGSSPPDSPGLVWCDVGATRLFEWRPGSSDRLPPDRQVVVRRA